MKTIYIILLTAFISISATVTATQVISTPALPKAVRISDRLSFQSTAEDFARECVHDGYIIKCFAASNGYYTVIAEKY